MKHLGEVDLQQRAKDILTNLLLLNNESKICLHQISKDSMKWMSLWIHILEEFSIRYGPYPAGFSVDIVRNIRSLFGNEQNSNKAANAVKCLNLPEGDYLFKYGKSKYLKEFINNGVLRILPASSYNDSSLNSAIRDKELEFSINPAPSDVKVKVYENKTGKSKGEIKPKNFVYKVQSKTNFYVSCFSSSLMPRLFLDFEADACLVIRKPEEFIDIILSSFEKIMQGWSGVSAKVTYIDPLNCSISKIDILCSKHFRYTYQKELRLIWLYKNTKKELEPVYITIPDIKEYCYLLEA